MSGLCESASRPMSSSVHAEATAVSSRVDAQRRQALLGPIRVHEADELPVERARGGGHPEGDRRRDRWRRRWAAVLVVGAGHRGLAEHGETDDSDGGEERSETRQRWIQAGAGAGAPAASSAALPGDVGLETYSPKVHRMWSESTPCVVRPW